ncbi:amidase [Cystobasidium minutum MCA 4210]|uniref:amidase n=1 Tax=Cystobasidium minutum MCA 4210 TaxID=1397322 RepID=UPI0034CF0FFC|eukprot:jgi/Rhomi1/164636/fgenesh1_kg.1_\
MIPPHHEKLPHVTKENWRELAAQKKQSVYDAIPKRWLLPKGKYDDLLNVMDVPKDCGILSSKDLEITEIDDVPVLAKKIAQEELSSAEVATAFCKRAAIAHQLTNCLTEILFDRAEKRAKELDEYLAQNGKPMGPLHGVPVSLKDQFDIKGVELNMGYGAYLGRISPANASLVDLLEALGAIIYVRTNIPQTLMIGDAFNHIYGRTVNPRNRKMSPGGSSGGEGALIAMKGSIIGIGTDIGGSVRMPSAFNALFTIRPSTLRVPYGKATNSMLGQESIRSVCGPMCRSVASVDYFMRVVLDACPADYDATAFPFPYNNKLHDKVASYKKLAFGYAKTDGHVHPVTPAIRAMDETIAALKAAGHEVFEFDLARYKRIWDLTCELYDADGGEDIQRILSQVDEPLIGGLILGSESRKKTVYELMQLNREKEAFQQEVLSKWLATVSQTTTGRPMDALLFPTVPSPVRRFDDEMYAGLTGIFNMLDLPACVVPVTFVDPAKDGKASNVEYFGDTDKLIHDQYDPEFAAGMPVTVQVVGRRWQEEALLAVTQKVAESLAK